MVNHVRIPIKMVGATPWGNLAALGTTHELVAESFKVVDQKYSFVGGHRMRLLSLKKNVHWRVSGAAFDISGVPPATAPRRAQLP